MRRYPQFRSTPAQVVALPSVGGVTETQTVRRRRGSALPGAPGNVQTLQGPPAVSGGGAQTIAVGQASESNSAQALQAAQSRAIAQATETDSATAIAAAQARAIAQATETDAAQAFTAAQARAIGQAAESDAAQPVAYAAPGSIAQAQESDSAQPIVVHHRIAIAQATETDAAQAVAVSNGITVTIGMALEIDVVLPLAGLRMGLGQAAETDTALPIVEPGGVVPEAGSPGFLARRAPWDFTARRARPVFAATIDGPKRRA